MSNIKRYNPENYQEMEEGEIVVDMHIRSFWRVSQVLPDSVVLRNLKGGRNATKIILKPESCRMEFVHVPEGTVSVPND